MHHNSLIINVKLRSAINAIRNLEGIMYFHVTLGLGMVLFLLSVGTLLFYGVFDFLMDLEVFGPPLMDRLVGIVFLAFFSMLIFSNLIITLSTSYISKEVDYLMSLPIGFSGLFRQKLLESIVYSSWAFVLLSLPFFLGFGLVRDVPLHFYLLVAVLIVPFLVIPATLGSILTMLVTAFLPAKKTRLLVVILAILSLGLAVLIARLMNIRNIFMQAEGGDFTQIMSTLEFGSSPLLPSSWMMNGLLAIGPASRPMVDYGTYFYWLAMLAATALFLVQVSEWLVPRLYYKGWALTKDSANRGEASRSSLSPMAVFDRIFYLFPRQWAALFSKDFKTFWRDPAQWTQLVILFGLMIIYIANLRNAQRYSGTVEFLVTEWRTLLAFFNLGATCFILSILTTRFIYPMLSLEGRQFWSVGLAPMKRSRIVWQKYAVCLSCSLVLALSLLMLSNSVLRIEPYLQVVSILVKIMLAVGLSSLTIGLGALLPNFKEDNPARIANGIGGTANALISLAYIGVTVGMIAVPVHRLGEEAIGVAFGGFGGIAYVLIFIALQMTVIFGPMYLGLKKWERLEF